MTSELKILQVIDRLEIGGAERVFLDITYLLLNENLHVDTLLISGKGVLADCIDRRANRYYLHRKWKFDPFKLFECATICARYQIVHVHMRHTYAYVKFAQIITFRKFKIVFHDHSGETVLNRRSRWTLAVLMKPAYYIGVSQGAVNWAISNLHIEKSRAFLLRNTVIPMKESIPISKKQDMLMIANIRPVKNIEFAIELANMLRRNLTIYGNTIPTKYCSEILISIDRSPYVELIQGETNVQRFIENYSIGIHTSHSETGPLVLLEYLAKGLPFLAHSTGEVAHLLKGELPESFICSLQIEVWEDRMKHLLQNPPSPHRLRALFEAHFGSKPYIQQCLAIYKQCVNS